MGATHYQVLGVPEDASYSQIRSTYLSSILALHPDKLRLPGNAPLPVYFLRLQEAWTVLRDSVSRSAYDRQLNSSRFSIDVVAEDVLLEEMSREPCEKGEEFEYLYPCRCGDFFAVSEEELEALGFKECSRGSGRQCGEVERRMEDCKEDGAVGNILAASQVVNEVFQTTRSEVDGVPEGHSGDLQRGSHLRHPSRHPSPSALTSLILPCGSCSLKIRVTV